MTHRVYWCHLCPWLDLFVILHNHPCLAHSVPESDMNSGPPAPQAARYLIWGYSMCLVRASVSPLAFLLAQECPGPGRTGWEEELQARRGQCGQRGPLHLY